MGLLGYYAAMRAAHIRKQRGLSQAELADIIGVEQPTISRFERGFDGVTLRLIKQIAAALGVSVAELFNEDAVPGEDTLLEVFRSLPPERRQGWIDLARVALADQKAQIAQKQ